MSTLPALMTRLPWITRLDEPQDCQAYKWTHMPRYVLADLTLMNRYKCRNKGRWQLAALEGTGRDARSGIYCWRHLRAQIDGHTAEKGRTWSALRKLQREQEARS